MENDEVARYWEANAATWTRLSRQGMDVYRDVLNTPAFLAMLPDIAGLSGLDVGCGEGTNTRRLAERGARMSAIDIAPTFIAHAEQAERERPLGIAFHVGDCAALPFDDASFDFVTAFMSLMDVPDQPGALAEACRVMRPGGFLQFSILHPCFVPPRRRNVRDADGTVTSIEVADYFLETDGDVETWWFSMMPKEDRAHVPPFRIPRFHRTLSTWVRMIGDAGLVIEDLAEPCASPEVARAHPNVADTRVAPIFLHIRARPCARA